MRKSLTDKQELKDYKIKTFLEAYSILEKLINNDCLISRLEILELIEYDKSLSKRAIDKIIERQNERFKRMFNLENDEYFYNRKIKKYQLVIEGIDKLLPYKIMFDYLQTLIHSKEIDKSKTEISKVLMFNNEYQFHDLPLIINITKAIVNQNCIEFEHFNHFRGEKAKHIVEPWFIKQYDNRFFLGCNRLSKNGQKDTGYRTFTINQILNNSLKIKPNQIVKQRKKDNLLTLRYDIFESCIGVRIHKEDKANEFCFRGDIKIETNYKTGKDWINIPIHKNQKLIDTLENGNHIFLFKNFFFNDAFKKIILSLGHAVKIVSPPEVIRELHEDFLKVNNKYNSPLF